MDANAGLKFGEKQKIHECYIYQFFMRYDFAKLQCFIPIEIAHRLAILF